MGKQTPIPGTKTRPLATKPAGTQRDLRENTKTVGSMKHSHFEANISIWGENTPRWWWWGKRYTTKTNCHLGHCSGQNCMRVWGTEQEISQTGLVSDLETVWRQFGKSRWREMFGRMGGVSKKKTYKVSASFHHYHKRIQRNGTGQESGGHKTGQAGSLK